MVLLFTRKKIILEGQRNSSSSAVLPVGFWTPESALEVQRPSLLRPSKRIGIVREKRTKLGNGESTVWGIGKIPLLQM